MPTPPDTVLDRLTAAYESARDPERGRQMSDYMRGQFPFVGIAKPERTILDRTVTAGLAAPSEADLVTVSARCWDLPEREYQYFAVEYLTRHHGGCSPLLLGHVRTLVTTKSWWDTVDGLATRVVGGLVRAHPELRAVMDEWVAAHDIWLARTAILHQLRWKADTDPDVLFAYCLRRAGDREFFLRKSIGWALRSYARVDPGAVRAFVHAHADRLSGLSQREALRRIGA